jgi:hypothetical protein
LNGDVCAANPTSNCFLEFTDRRSVDPACKITAVKLFFICASDYLKVAGHQPKRRATCGMVLQPDELQQLKLST